MVRAVAAVLIALTLAVAACGDEESSGTEVRPAAGELTPIGGTPGVPAGAGYDVTGSEWLELEELDRFEAALEFIDDNPDFCTGDRGTAAADPVRDYADASIGTDYPLTDPMAELLAEGCAAALQSGTQDLAE